MKAGLRIGAAVCVALLAALPARAVDKDTVQRAVDKGVAYLKGTQGPDGAWRYAETNVAGDATAGATALCALALLESGVPANDPAVVNAARAVREQGVGLSKTYSLSLAIMFLDRLGDPADNELIAALAVRLLAGQEASSGGWSYSCPAPTAAEAQRLQQALRNPNPPARVAPPDPAKGRPSVQDLPKEIQHQLRLINNQAGAPALGGGPTNDNSNTQFAVLALWIARRTGIPVETAMRRIDSRFRTTQRADGGWSYFPVPPSNPVTTMPGGPGPGLFSAGSSPAMTCAGLLGLALGHGSAVEATLHTAPAGGAAGPPPRDLNKDPVIRRALVALGSVVDKPLERSLPPPIQGTGRAYYLLFSLERVAVAYGLETLGKKDWYDWGADFLLRNQRPDGSWNGDYGPVADTPFALLFLRRANLAQDLTATLKGRVLDPGTRDIKAVDIEDLTKGGEKTEPPARTAPPEGVAPKETRPAEAAVDPEVKRLSDELVKADAGRQDQVLDNLRNSKGVVYTDALAHSIHRLSGAVKSKARDALAERLTRMKKETLDDKLKDDDIEVRRAAALACAMKGEKEHLPRLMEMMEDPELEVARAAYAALRNLTGKDFGPGKDAGRPDFSRAADAWKAWWSRNGGK
jgi:hypothetical protein